MCVNLWKVILILYINVSFEENNIFIKYNICVYNIYDIKIKILTRFIISLENIKSLFFYTYLIFVNWKIRIMKTIIINFFFFQKNGKIFVVHLWILNKYNESYNWIRIVFIDHKCNRILSFKNCAWSYIDI